MKNYILIIHFENSKIRMIVLLLNFKEKIIVNLEFVCHVTQNDFYNY